MALHKMDNPQIDLKSDGGNDDGGKATVDLNMADHKKKFTEKIEKIISNKQTPNISAEKMETKERTAEKKPAAEETNGEKNNAGPNRLVTDLRRTLAHEAMPKNREGGPFGLAPDRVEAHVPAEKNLPEKTAEGNNVRPQEVVTDLKHEPACAKRRENIAANIPIAPATEHAEIFAPLEMKRKYERLEFPAGFLWGTATSAYQVEGGIENDWSQWEKSYKRLRQLMKKKKRSEDYICGRACDSYRRFAEDLDLAKTLNNNAVRFGLEWSRIQPKEDMIDIEAINHYRQVLREAKKRGLKTIVTLWHYTNPLWLTQKKGWENKKAAEYFSAYVDLVVRELGADIDYWITINEPNMYVFGAYLHNQFPPQKWSILLAIKAFLNLTRAHNRAYRIIHRHFPRAQVGFTGLFNCIEPADKWNPIELGLAWLLHFFWNGWLLARTRGHFDFIGANYYFHDRIVWYPPFKLNQNEWVNDKGWEIYPKGIYHVLKYLHKFGKPILITENGVADAEDRHRENFIKRHLYWTHRAIAEGVDVRGYFYWSLLDNFEWADGWPPKFGLYAVDKKTFARKARQSALVYADICAKNRVKIKT